MPSFQSMFPGKVSVPAGCLWSLRVWRRVNGIDHRLFGEDDLWIAKDPDFNAIGDASFARLRNLDGEQSLSWICWKSIGHIYCQVCYTLTF